MIGAMSFPSLTVTFLFTREGLKFEFRSRTMGRFRILFSAMLSVIPIPKTPIPTVICWCWRTTSRRRIGLNQKYQQLFGQDTETLDKRKEILDKRSTGWALTHQRVLKSAQVPLNSDLNRSMKRGSLFFHFGARKGKKVKTGKRVSLRW